MLKDIVAATGLTRFLLLAVVPSAVVSDGLAMGLRPVCSSRSKGGR